MNLEKIEGDIDDRGLAPDFEGVETHYARCEAVATVHTGSDDGFVSVIADYQYIYIETRIPFDALARGGWTPPAHEEEQSDAR